MINIENEIYNFVSENVRAEYPGIYMTGEYVQSPPSFPATLLVEMDNSAYNLTQTSSDNENHAIVMYEVDTYSNKKTGKKTECKAIMTLIDNLMKQIGFTRTMMQPIPNMDDATIYRMKARYTAIVSKDKTIFRR